MDSNSQRPISTTETRQATTEGVGRYVLAISLALVVSAFVIIYSVYFG